MSTYGGVVKEIPILPTPIANASTLVRGNLVEIASGLAVIWGGVNPVYGVCTGDADNELHIIYVYTGGGASVQILCDTGVVPTPGQLLYYSSAAGVKVSGGTAGDAIGIAVGAGLNGMVEAILFPGGIAEQTAVQTALNAILAATAALGAAQATFGAAYATYAAAQATYATAIAAPVTTVAQIVTAEAALASATATFATAEAALTTAWATYTTAIAAI